MGPVHLRDMEDEPFILREHCERSREALEVLTVRGIRLRTVLRTGQERRALDLVAAGLGVTIAPASLTTESRVPVARVPIDDLGLARTVGLHLSPSLDEATVKPLLDTVERLAPALPEVAFPSPARPSDGRALS
jgi:DNA-binding transcriptional LysR family regulator